MPAAEPVMVRLHQALEGGVLPPQGHKIGQRLMSQLHQPTRIAVIGLAGSGKSRLINLVLGADLMPEFDGIAAVEIGYGEAPRTQFTLSDGTIEQMDGLPQAGSLPAGISRISLLVPDPLLQGWSFAEISLISSPKVQSELMAWAAERSDFAIWCTASFEDREHSLWSAMPDHLKDNSVLALTRADRLFMKGELAERIARLQPIVADEFRCLYPVATLQAASARAGNTVTNDALWRSSGGLALVEGIRAQVEQARMADLDHAYMLLERFKVATTEDAAHATAPVQAPLQAPVQAPVQAPPLAPAAAPAAKAAPTAAAAAPAAATAAAARPARSARSEAVIQRALAVLQGCAEDLLQPGTAARGEATDRILERCTATAQNLVRLLDESDADTPELEALRDDVLEGEQMLMLLRLERGDTAAEDSLTVLLQMKKEISERVAG